MVTLVWLRRDLRTEDNPALCEACQRGNVIAVYIYDLHKKWSEGGASKWWLHHSLEALQKKIPVVIREGEPLKVIEDILKETSAKAVFWNRLYEPEVIKNDSKIQVYLEKQGIAVKTFNSSLLFEPWEVKNLSGKPFQVFTPFWKKCLSLSAPREPLGIPNLKSVLKLDSLPLDALKLLPTIPWDKGIREKWEPGEEEAKKKLKNFVSHGLKDYKTTRDLPYLEKGTSKLSPYLHFGEISPNMIWKACQGKVDNTTFLNEIGWREFAHHLLYYFPFTPEKPLREKFAEFPWDYNEKNYHAWCKGLTGYPIVDAGMRELWKTGWMHNRVRMIVASFLVKDLLIQWQDGEKWFWDTLLDADLANNTLGWQWAAGCGADAAPYFRIFNPVLQGQKFDPEGEYVKRYIPELQKLPKKWIHSPWLAPPEVLHEADVTLGSTYPNPIVDHNEARKKALRALSLI